MLMSAVNNPVKESFYKKTFLILNNITHISTHFLTPQVFQKTSNNNSQTTLPNTPLMF